MTILKNEKKTGGNAKTKAGVPGHGNEPQGAHQFGDAPPNVPPRSQQMYPPEYVGPGPSVASTSFHRLVGLNMNKQYGGGGARFGRNSLTNVLVDEYKTVQGKRMQRTLSDDPSKRRKSLLVQDTRETVKSSPPADASTPGQATTTASTSTADEKGCNSEDEYDSRTQESMTEDELREREAKFVAKMAKKGLIIKAMGEDGACLFRAIADQVYGDQDMHEVIRKQCMDYIAQNRDYFSQYITEDFTDYVNRKRLNHVHGNHIEIQAISEMYNRTVEVYCYRSDPMNIFNREPAAAAAQAADYLPLRLSYHRGTHYNSVVDPNKPAVGVGLGLPGIQQGLADKKSLEEATKKHEDVNIEQTMLEDKLRATDWEATDEAINEEVARESYLQWLRENEGKGKRSPKAGTSTMMMSPPRALSPKPKMKNVSRGTSPLNLPETKTEPAAAGGGPSSASSASLQGSSQQQQQDIKLAQTLELAESLTFVTQLPPDLFGVDAWDDSQGIMAQVLAASQQEYLDHLKSQRSQQSQSQNRREGGEPEANPAPNPEDGDLSPATPNEEGA